MCAARWKAKQRGVRGVASVSVALGEMRVSEQLDSRLKPHSRRGRRGKPPRDNMYILETLVFSVNVSRKHEK